jgi:aldehyde dehydrogenase (NAD+)
MAEECVDTPFMIGPGKSYIVKEPLGVVAVLGSWNYPLYTSLCPMINAIAAGNCVVLKPSEMAPYTSRVLKKIIAFNLDTSCY